MQQRGFDKEPKVEGVRKLLNAACELVPQLRNCTLLESWAGLRPGTPDDLPILGRTPEANLFVATGHFRNGILLTPITAKLMTDCILNGVQVPTAFHLERFQNAA
jgi:glycine/D-amino acid oxidase-like deaminating enzyme